MANALIVYDSATGNTELMAKSIGNGIQEAGVTVKIQNVSNTVLNDLLDADAIILGSPTYFGNMSGKMKAFIDRTEKFYPDKLQNKIGAVFVSAGAIGDGCETALISLIEALLIHRLIIVGLQANAKVLNHSGGALGALSIGLPDEECLMTCREFGKRIAGFINGYYP
jgi:NAD(P)H dehydrogenase (quinone)